MRSFFAGVLLLTFSLSTSCAKRPAHPAPDVVTPGAERSVPTLRLLQLSPSAGSRVDSSTVIEAVLEYHVADSQKYPGPYTVNLTFQSTIGGSFRSATPEERRRGGPINQALESQTGQVKLEYPLSLVWGVKTLAKPVRLFFMLQSPAGGTPQPVRVSESIGPAKASGRQIGDTLRVRGLAGHPQAVIGRVTVEYGQAEQSDVRGQSANRLAREGYALSPGDAETLERKLETQPDDLSARTRLLGYYFARSLRVSGPAATIEARRRHILWIIQNHPDAELAGLSAATLDPHGHPLADKVGYQEARELWLKQEESYKNNTSFLGNAANFLRLHDKVVAERMLRKAQMLESDNQEWSWRLGVLYALGILGVDGVTENGLPTSFDPVEAEGEFATKARDELEGSSNSVLLGSAGMILFQYPVMLQALRQRKLEPELLDLAEGLLMKAQQLEPEDPKTPMLLAELYKLRQRLATSPEEKDAAARKALAAMETMANAANASADDEGKLVAIVGVAKAAFGAGAMSKAEAYAKESLKLASELKDNSMYGTAIHVGHVILGRVALRIRPTDTEGAKKHLIEAGKTPGGGTLSSFGPNMALAKELLELGERDVVIEYLELCKSFWSMGKTRGTLNQWIATIVAGGIPEFGANLSY